MGFFYYVNTQNPDTMLTPSKKKKLLSNLKAFQKKYFNKSLGDLDESGTRLMVNDLLTTVLGYKPIEEIKTEYMIPWHVCRLYGPDKRKPTLSCRSQGINPGFVRQASSAGY
jgi:hypothetical protein